MNTPSPLQRADWERNARLLRFRTQAFINGEYRPSFSGRVFDCQSPIDGRVLCEVARCDQQDVDAAVQAARHAFEHGPWRREKPAARKRVLLAFSELLLKHRDELALLETLDMGKPIRDSLRVDIPSAARSLAWSAEALDKLYDQIAPTGSDEIGLITRHPVGVVGVIVPWNFPLLMACWKLGPALGAGNSVVLKPSEKSPLTALRIAELAMEAGLPPGVLNVLPGYGDEVGSALALHMDVDCVAFTGSTRVGKQLMVYSGQSNLKRVWTECGGKTPNIVFADAPDLDAAAKAAASAIFFNQGEVCTAGSRLLVERGIREDFIERVCAAGERLRPGHPLDPDTRLGAMVDEAQMQTALRYIAQGHAEGARLRLGGARALAESGGFYVEPTIFDQVSNDMRIAREEIFGPVLSVIAFDTPEEALRIANDSPYGLAAALWTRDLSKAHRLARDLQSGSVWVNCWDGGDMSMPFGGFKQSGNGRDKSLHAFDKFTELKSTWIAL